MPDYVLKVALQRVKSTPSRFALIKGKKSDEVYVSPQPANAKQLAPVMEACGDGKTVATGICLLENGQLVFATKSEPAGAWEMMINKALKGGGCASFLPILMRKMGKGEDGENPGEETEGQQKESEESPNDVTSGGDDKSQKLQAALAKLMPIIKQAVADHPNRKAEILQPLQVMQKHMKAQEFPQATVALQTAANLLKSLRNGGSPTGNGMTTEPKPGDEMQQFTTRRDKLEKSLLAAQKAAPDKASKLLQVWDYAQQQAEAGKFPVAFKALDGLQTTIEKILATGPISDTERFGIADGIVAERVQKLEAYFAQRVEQARQSSVAGVEKMKATFAELIEESSELAAAINKDLNTLYEAIKTRLNKALETGSRSKIAQEIANCRGTVATDGLIQHLAKAPAGLGVDSGVPAQFTALFDDAVSQMEMSDA